MKTFEAWKIVTHCRPPHATPWELFDNITLRGEKNFMWFNWCGHFELAWQPTLKEIISISYQQPGEEKDQVLTHVLLKYWRNDTSTLSVCLTSTIEWTTLMVWWFFLIQLVSLHSLLSRVVLRKHRCCYDNLWITVKDNLGSTSHGARCHGECHFLFMQWTFQTVVWSYFEFLTTPIWRDFGF